MNIVREAEEVKAINVYIEDLKYEGRQPLIFCFHRLEFGVVEDAIKQYKANGLDYRPLSKLKVITENAFFNFFIRICR